MDAPHISPLVLGFFRRIVRGYFRRHFTAVRITRAPTPACLGEAQLIVFANHGSWWDPMVSVLLGQELMPARRHFAPMDADVLRQFRILRSIGVFGVELASARGAARFVRGGLAILEHKGVLWITPQGRFADVRERPLGFKPGMAMLAARAPGGCTLLPLAIEYVFWNERLPEVLLHCGEPVQARPGQPADELTARLEAAQLAAMQHLQQLALARDPAAFRTLIRGRAGTGGFYALFERVRAALRRRTEKSTAPTPSAAPDRELR